MPMIRIEMFEGRTVEQKRACAKAVTEAFLATCGGRLEAGGGGGDFHRHCAARLGLGRQAVLGPEVKSAAGVESRYLVHIFPLRTGPL